MPNGDPVRGNKTPLTSSDERTELQSEEQARDAQRRSSAEIDVPAVDQDNTVLGLEEGELLARLARLGPPYRVPGYVDWAPLGAGTFGQVWRARNESTIALVAIKFYVSSAAEVEREVRRLAQLAHTPGIIGLEGVYLDAPVPYLVMEYADHGSLSALLAKGPLPVKMAVRIFREAAEALAYVHAKGILHCDLKPGNILLDVRDHVRLADFGQAQLASELVPSLGTFFYMAPEQADPSTPVPDTRWDVYALGAVLYAMLTGEAPHRGEDLSRRLRDTAPLGQRLELYRTLLREMPRPAVRRKVRGVDRDLADILDHCLELDPTRRLSDASAILAALARARARKKQRPLFAFGLVAALLLLALVVGLTSWLGTVAQGQAEEELTEQLRGSNKDTARVIADAIGSRLRPRIRQVGHAANRPNLARMVVRNDRKGLEQFLDEHLLLRANNQPSRRYFSAWVTNREGKILAVRHLSRPQDPEEGVIGIDPVEVHKATPNFTWREWFNGQADWRDDRKRIHPMVSDLHVSDPFYSRVGTATMIAISAPIRGGAGGPDTESVGLLSAGVRFNALAGWLSESARLSHNGTVLVLNHIHHDGRRCPLLAGGVITEPATKEARLASYPRFAFPEVERALDGETLAGTQYTSPLDHKVYLAGCARTREQPSDDEDPRQVMDESAPIRTKLDWVVIVQHEKAEALAPLDRLREQMDFLRLLACAGAAVLVGGLWGCLFWVLRRQDGLAGV
jgi:hypothetical protein